MKELDVEAHVDPMDDESQPDPSTVESSAKEDFTGLSDLCWVYASYLSLVFDKIILSSNINSSIIVVYISNVLRLI